MAFFDLKKGGRFREFLKEKNPLNVYKMFQRLIESTKIFYT
jgi:hypothetical protein